MHSNEISIPIACKGLDDAIEGVWDRTDRESVIDAQFILGHGSIC